MLKRFLGAALLVFGVYSNAYAFSLLDLLNLFFSRPLPPADFRAEASSPTTADLSWKAGGSNISGYVLLTFHDAKSWEARFPRSCRLYVSDHDPKSHDDDDEAESEDKIAFPRIDKTPLGKVSRIKWSDQNAVLLHVGHVRQLTFAPQA